MTGLRDSDMCECDRPDEADNPHRHTRDSACIYWLAGRPGREAILAAHEGRLPMTDPRSGPSDTRECGFMGCGRPPCVDVCAGIPQDDHDFTTADLPERTEPRVMIQQEGRWRWRFWLDLGLTEYAREGAYAPTERSAIRRGSKLLRHYYRSQPRNRRDITGEVSR